MALQSVAGVEIRHWQKPLPPLIPHALVIEAFACRLPEAFLQSMVGQPLLWLNLEYLSAEAWVAGCHGLSSPHPRLALTQRFFFPGFTPDSGGLLREADLLTRRDAFQANAEAQMRFWHALGVPETTGELKVSLFSYETPALDSLLRGWQAGPQPLRLLVPEGRALVAIAASLGVPLKPGQPWQRGALTIQALPFTEQDSYDQLLWACDINIVRGEDSLLRALWAGRPLLWHIYPQDEGAHWPKLQAMLDHYCQNLDIVPRQLTEQLWHGYNRGANTAAASWAAWQAELPRLRVHAQQWCLQQAKLPDLAGNLVNCHQLRVK